MYYTFVYYSFKRPSYGPEKRYGPGNGIIFYVRFTFLCIGVVLACFQISDITDVKRELLKRSVSGADADITSANALCFMLFNKSGPEVLLSYK